MFYVFTQLKFIMSDDNQLWKFACDVVLSTGVTF